VAENVKDKLKQNVEHAGNGTAEHDEEAKQVDDGEDADDAEDADSDHVGIDTSDGEELNGPVPPSGPARAPEGLSAASETRLQATKTHVSGEGAPIADQPKSSYQPIAIGDEDPVDAPGQQDRRDGKLDGIFAFHSSRRMKPSTTKARRGVSIASREYRTTSCLY
jgi:phosphatidylinositol-3,4,5-trisphosphate 3-phosphatase/dual-specificity protein phosphatase PTEN